MSTVDRNALRKFLDDNGCKTTDECMEAIEPFFVIAETGEYTFKASKDINRGKLKRRYQAVIGNPVKKFSSFSLQRPYPKPNWLLTVNSTDFWKKLPANTSYQRVFDETFWYGFKRAITDGFWRQLGNVLMSRYWDNMTGSLTDTLRRNLFLFVGLHLGNEKEEADKIKPLLELLTDCIPLGLKADDPETVIVVVA